MVIVINNIARSIINEKLNGNKRRLKAAMNRTLIVIVVVRVNDPKQRWFRPKATPIRSGPPTQSAGRYPSPFPLPFQVLNRLELIRIRESFVRVDAPFYCRSILLVLLPLPFPSTPLLAPSLDSFSRISLQLSVISPEDGSEELCNIAEIMAASPFRCLIGVYTLRTRAHLACNGSISRGNWNLPTTSRREIFTHAYV